MDDNCHTYPLASKARHNELFSATVDQDQTARNVQSDLGSTLADRKIPFSQSFETASF